MTTPASEIEKPERFSAMVPLALPVSANVTAPVPPEEVSAGNTFVIPAVVVRVSLPVT